MSYTAIIVEPREHKALPYVLENFLKNLSEEWSFILFHGNKNVEFVTDLLNGRLRAHQHRIRRIQMNVDNLTLDDYNNLFKYNRSFYDCIPTETFLVFQTDSVLFEKNKHLINAFLQYDYVGAPWNHYPRPNELVGNGGLSLRKKSKMLEIMEKEGKNDLPEDVYFSCPQHVSIYKPSFTDALFFSVEEVFHAVSFGCHKPWGRYYRDMLYDMHEEVRELYKYNDVLPIIRPANECHRNKLGLGSPPCDSSGEIGRAHV
jgi:hypothetical protein